MGAEFDLPRNWRLKKQRYSLIGEVCPNPDCEAKIFPPRDICPHCGGSAHEEYQFSGKGEVFSYTTIYDAPEGYEENAPYTVALVKLEEGPMLTAQLTDLGEKSVEIGMPVEMVTRRLRSDGDRGMLVYGYKFRPAREALHDAGLERVDALLVTNMLSACSTTGQLNLGARVADWIGLRGIEAYKVEAAGGSGGAGFRAAW